MELLPAVVTALLSQPNTDSPWIPNETLFIRTVTYHLTGRVLCEKGGFLILTEAAWIADSGRFMTAIETGELGEVEPVTVPVRVNTASIVDAYHWKHPLPREQK